MRHSAQELALEPALEDALAQDGPVVAALRTAFPYALAIYAFGSRTQGTARPDSDLDLAVLVAGYAEPLQLWDLASQLAEWVHCDVDLLADIAQEGKIYG